MIGTLTKISSNANDLRTGAVTGQFLKLPEPGKRFCMLAPPLDGGDLRLVATSPVLSVTDIDRDIEFKTLNSTYRLETQNDS